MTRRRIVGSILLIASAIMTSTARAQRSSRATPAIYCPDTLTAFGEKWLVASPSYEGPDFPRHRYLFQCDGFRWDAARKRLTLILESRVTGRRAGAPKWRGVQLETVSAHGFGAYVAYVEGNVGALPPAAVVGLFTYDENGGEIDIESSSWGDPSPSAANLSFTVFRGARDKVSSTGRAPPATVATLGFAWTRTSVRFARRSTVVPAKELFMWSATSGRRDQWMYPAPQSVPDRRVPVPTRAMPFFLNVWMSATERPGQPEGRYEVVITDLELPPAAGADVPPFSRPSVLKAEPSRRPNNR